MRYVLLTVLIVLPLVASGQEAAIGTMPPPPAVRMSGSATPVLTTAETLQIDNLHLRLRLARAIEELAACQAALGPLRAHVDGQELAALAQRLKADIEANHPGYRWDDRTGQLVKQR